MALMPRAEDDDRRRIGQDRRITRVTHLRKDLGIDTKAGVFQGLRQQQTPGPMLVSHGAMAGLAVNEDDLGAVGCLERLQRQ